MVPTVSHLEHFVVCCWLPRQRPVFDAVAAQAKGQKVHFSRGQDSLAAAVTEAKV
jgi:hypothetical protein